MANESKIFWCKNFSIFAPKNFDIINIFSTFVEIEKMKF